MTKFFKPVTPSLRGTVGSAARSLLYKGSPLKCLTSGGKNGSGRNNLGRITVRHQGGRFAKFKYRYIDFQRLSKEAIVERIEYDPNRSGFIALLRDANETFSYILSPDKLSVGTKIESHVDADILVGNALPLKKIPVGTSVFNVELKPNKGGQIARSAGTFVQLLGFDKGYALLRLPSGEIRKVLDTCIAVIGSVSNPGKKNIKLGKAGRSRWLGIRPSVRGVAMNPVDHPHGGGEGKTSGGRHPVTPWGKCTKGKKTAKKNKLSLKYVVKKRV